MGVNEYMNKNVVSDLLISNGKVAVLQM